MLELKRKNGSGSGVVKAPSFDPYNRYSNRGDGMFGFRKDRHVVIPGVTYFEEARLKKVKDYIEEETKKPCTLSQELINDVYSIFVNKDIKRRPEDNFNKTRHNILDRVYDSLTKTVTVDSPLFTQMMTRELALALQKVDDEIREEQNKQEPGSGDGDGAGLETGMGDTNGDGDGNDSGEGMDGSDGDGNQAGKGPSDATRDIVDNALDNAKKSIEKAKNNASKKIKDLEDKLGKKELADLSDNEPDFLDKIERLKSQLNAVSIDKNSIKKTLEKILNESQNYFSPKFKRLEESLLDCEECEDLFGLEFLHPVFGKAGILSVGNEHRIYKGKMDLYLDCSASMNSSDYYEGKRISRMNLVKGIAMVMFRMGLIENLYFFENNIYQVKNINELTILSFSKSGGTDFDKVVQQIKTNGNNAVVITDGEDGCRYYDKKVFWVGVGGTQFGRNDKFTDYRANKQCVTYNSNRGDFDYCIKSNG